MVAWVHLLEGMGGRGSRASHHNLHKPVELWEDFLRKMPPQLAWAYHENFWMKTLKVTFPGVQNHPLTLWPLSHVTIAQWYSVYSNTTG